MKPNHVRKFERPRFLKEILSQAAYERWLQNKARAHVRRDRKRGNRSCTPSGYKSAIHEAVIRSKGRDAYTREKLDWSLLSAYDNEASKSGGRAYKSSLALLPTVDHIGDCHGPADFAICAWRTNDSKNDLPFKDFLDVCRKVVAATKGASNRDGALNAKKRLFKRIVLSIDDFQMAAECADQILERNLHSATTRSDTRLLRALNTALVISYGRPFSGNRSTPDVQKTLPDRYLGRLSTSQLRLHRQLIDARNRDHAHSDPVGRDLRVNPAEVRGLVFAFPAMRDANAPWPRELIERVGELIGVFLAELAADYINIQKELSDDGGF